MCCFGFVVAFVRRFVGSMSFVSFVSLGVFESDGAVSFVSLGTFEK